MLFFKPIFSFDFIFFIFFVSTGVCHASVWYDRNLHGYEIKFPTFYCTPSNNSHYICWYVISDCLWTLCFEWLDCWLGQLVNTYLIFNVVFSALTMLIGICIPFFGSLLGFLGGFAFAPTSYFVSRKHIYYFLTFKIYYWIWIIENMYYQSN